MDYLALVIGQVLVWSLGIAVIMAMPRREALLTQPGAATWVVGAGAFAGAFALTLVMRALSLLGIPFSLAAVGIPVVILTGALGFVGWQREKQAASAALAAGLRTLVGGTLKGAWRALWFALLVWLTLRFSLLLIEVVVKPLYPWDAWIQWATKARVWYELGGMVPFERADAWFASGNAYFDASPNYPGTVPLLMVWANITLGRWDDALMNLPFWQLAVGFCFAIYGVLRGNGYGPAGSLVGAWMVVSLPLANVHVALAGYADLPLATFFALAALAGLRWTATRVPADGLLALLFIAACPTLKVPGAVWALVLVPGLLVALMGRRGMQLVGIGFAVLGVALVGLARTSPTIMGYALHLDFDPAWSSLGSSFFLLGNWHLLWYGVVGVAIVGYRQAMAPALAPLTAIVLTSLAFLLVVFSFTNAREWVENQTTINRAALHAAPLFAIWMLLLFGEWWRAREAATIAQAGDAVPVQ